MKKTRLEILQSSLENKKRDFNRKIDAHYAAVLSVNGQPLNDKRNGRATLSRWKAQEDTLRNIQKSIERTENAIIREEAKIQDCEHVKEKLPSCLLEALARGEITQWRKYPHIFFVHGVEKGRIVYDVENNRLLNKYYREITDDVQKSKFRDVYNSLYRQI